MTIIFFYKIYDLETGTKGWVKVIVLLFNTGKKPVIGDDVDDSFSLIDSIS